MYCRNCQQEYPDDENCPHCQSGETPPIHRSGAPTLIKGPANPVTARPNRPGDRREKGLFPLLWAAAILVAVPWLLTDRSHPLAVDAPPAAAPVWNASAASSDIDSDQIHLAIKVPAKHWIDTGIDMCGCAHINITAAGTWITPDRSSVSARGVNVSPAVFNYRDALDHSIRYGALIGRVGHDPYVDLGASSHVDGDQFNDTGTLKIGMNAGGVNDPNYKGDGDLIVHIDGEGTLDHAPVNCPVPR